MTSIFTSQIRNHRITLLMNSKVVQQLSSLSYMKQLDLKQPWYITVDLPSSCFAQIYKKGCEMRTED